MPTSRLSKTTMVSATFQSLPLTSMRKAVAARMTGALRTIPHFRLVAEIEVDALLLLRKQLCEYPHEGISLNALFVKACATALMDVPGVNLQWSDTEVRQYRDADIAIVTALPGGLATPIVRSANMKSIREIARETKLLVKRAAENRLKVDEVCGGSFSISNLGVYGVDQFDAIINPPQCAILAVGRSRPVLLPDTGGRARVANTIMATLSVDHRAIDGATAAGFMEALRGRIEQPDHLLADREMDR